ncbi:MAG TPA: YceI family protein [Bryobacteraceae bacterium]|nr:YceI family protein [Bryobacteraceae bacterium]
MSTPNPSDAAAVPVIVYVLDSGLSRFTAKAFATGLLASMGHNPSFAIRQFSGEAQFRADAPEQSSVRIVVQAGSLELLDQVSDKDRREIERATRDDVLDAGRFSEIVFEASNPSMSKGGEGHFWANISGTLTLRGKTQPQQITAQISVTENQLHANGEFTVRQSSYGIKPVSVAGGTLKIKDDVKVTFDLQARKKD